MSVKQRFIKLLSILAFPVFILILGFLAFKYKSQLLLLWQSKESIIKWVESKGKLAPLAFITIQILQVIIFMIPGELIQISGGFAFGLWLGTLWSTAGILIGSIFNFYAGRLLGRPFAQALLGMERFQKVEKATAGTYQKLGFFVFFVIPGIPKDALSYAAGASSLSAKSFILVSVLGRLPGIFGSSYIGSAMYKENYLLALLILLIAVFLFVLGFFYKNKLQKFLEKP